MLPPSSMVTIKNRVGYSRGGRRKALLFTRFGLPAVVLSLLLCGCTPAGPRALLEGQRLIDEGKYPQAIQKLKTAASLLGGTNAQAWNYLGVAYQHAGSDAEAEWAYQRALSLDHDLSEARFNLGCLWLSRNKLEAAKTEFTAYTLRRPNMAEGFVKLGTTQLRSREPSAAEKSFNEALRLNPQDLEALNGQGLARLQRGRAAEAVQSFESALKKQPGYAPALLNLAIVSHQYLRDRQVALQKYRDYLALKPPPPNADAVAATVRQLEQELNPQVRRVPTNAVAQLSPSATPPRAAVTNQARTTSASKAEPVSNATRTAAANRPKATQTNAPKPAPVILPAPSATVEVAKLPPEPVVRRAEDIPAPPAPSPPSVAEPVVTTSSVPANVSAPKTAKRGFFETINPLNLFRGAEQTPVRPTPLESASASPRAESPKTEVASSGAETTDSSPAPARTASGRYVYKSPATPSSGNRSDAERTFAEGVQAYQAGRLAEAIKAYRLATRQDPSLFEAHYNLGLVATEAGNLSLALSSYENALAIRPTSLDARYNFALALKQANCLTDAVIELERVLAKYPNETRAHLALGNLYAQHFGQPVKARQHYLKVLELDPRHSQAGAIRYWLAANPL
jgi:Flp pilus assembly protein TadD